MVESRVRPLRAHDIDAVVSIDAEAHSHGYSETGFLVTPLTAHAIRLEQADARVRYAVAEAAGEVVGFIKYSTRSLQGYQQPAWLTTPVTLTGGTHIERVAVRADRRCTGIGTSLYADLYRRCAGALLYTYVVVSPCPNTASIAFHDALGFASVAHVPYAMDNGSWFLERLYVLREPSRLGTAALSMP